MHKQKLEELRTLLNERALPVPYLATALPQLETDTWRVLPDGRMETTFVLRPGLTWHDGEPLTAEDAKKLTGG